MTLGDWIDGIAEDIREELRDEVKEEIREEITRKVQEQNIRTVIEMFQEYHETKESAISKLRTKFPEYADEAVNLVEKYWKENL